MFFLDQVNHYKLFVAANFPDANLTGAIMPDGEVYQPVASVVNMGDQEVL
jgi:hypothetical protein